ncbi:hypothetical protein LEP1GSC092_3036 [Leptospira interrogans serovar Pyrogenes str. R168]|nr:hypothetical protein LEP1GSC092_3036 [Leptospira interrogans serovar Pyrogenes str. R168]
MKIIFIRSKDFLIIESILKLNFRPLVGVYKFDVPFLLAK